MLSRLAKQKRTVSLYITEHIVKIAHLLTYEWKLFEKCIVLLKSFEEATKIRLKKLCLFVIPHFEDLLRNVESYVDEMGK